MTARRMDSSSPVTSRWPVRFSSNGTVYSDGLAARLRQFEDAFIGFSVDATQELHEYLRPPSRFEAVIRNVRAFIETGIRYSIDPTPQAYNVFGLLDLIRFCDRNGWPFGLGNILSHPRCLSFDVLPEEVLREALAEWEEYRARECRTELLAEVDTLLAALRRPRPRDQDALQDEFIRFTNDLDRSRGQSLAQANPRLQERFVRVKAKPSSGTILRRDPRDALRSFGVTYKQRRWINDE